MEVRIPIQAVDELRNRCYMCILKVDWFNLVYDFAKKWKFTPEEVLKIADLISPQTTTIPKRGDFLKKFKRNL